MTLPGILIGIVISSLYGSAFHLLRGGGLGRVLLYIIMAWVGFLVRAYPWQFHWMAFFQPWLPASGNGYPWGWSDSWCRLLAFVSG